MARIYRDTDKIFVFYWLPNIINDHHALALETFIIVRLRFHPKAYRASASSEVEPIFTTAKLDQTTHP